LSKSAVVEIAELFRKALDAKLSLQMLEMGQRWIELQNKIDANVIALLAEIGDSKPNPAQIREMQRWAEMREQVHAELSKYQDYVGSVIDNGKEDSAKLGIQSAKETLSAAFSSAGIMGSFNIVPIDSVEALSAILAKGAPLQNLLAAAFPESWVHMSSALIEGIGLGLGPRETAKRAFEGMNYGFDRILTITRTEQLRAYRNGSILQYRESGVVTGFKRLSARDDRTCMACLISDGERYNVADEFADHPNGRCAIVPIVAGVDEPEWENGTDWFLSQDPEKQRAMMGKNYYEAWKDGAFELSDLRRTAHSDIWGDSPQIAALKEFV